MKKAIVLLITLMLCCSFAWAGEKEDLAVKIVDLQQQLQVIQDKFNAEKAAFDEKIKPLQDDARLKTEALQKLQEEYKKAKKAK